MTKYTLLKGIPEIKGNVLRIYTTLKKFKKSKYQLSDADKLLPFVGPIQDNEGDVYYGQMKLGKKHGYGKQIKAEGSIYEGFWQDDKPAFYGRNIFIEGEAYQGQMNSNQEPHGNG